MTKSAFQLQRIQLQRIKIFRAMFPFHLNPQDFFFKILTPLLLGAGIYILYRSPTIIINDFLLSIGFENQIGFLKSIFPEQVLYGIKFSLPNALWLVSIQFYMMAIWRNSKYVGLILSIIMSLGLILAEYLQKWEFLSGTYCETDILYIVIATTFILFLNSKIQFQRTLNSNWLTNFSVSLITLLAYGSFAMWTGDV